VITTPVLFLPGSLCDERLFEHQLEALPGATVADLTGARSIAEMAENVLAVAPDEFVLVGLSLGVIVAIVLASAAPSRTRGLALLDTNLGAPSPEQMAERSRWAQSVRSGEFAGVVANDMIPRLTAYPERHAPRIFDMAYDMGPAAFLDQNRALMDRRDRRPDLEEIDCPVLIACGGNDVLCPPALHVELADRSPQSWLEIFDDAGHLSTLDQPNQVTKTLTKWLDQGNTKNQHPRRGSNEQVKA
jgi:pimeloyl-ACP methyl ester carboxylesterase